MIKIPLFIPSYHRADNLKTVKTNIAYGWCPSSIFVFVDSEADDQESYQESCARYGCNLVVFDMEEARSRYDYIFSPGVSRRSAGQARNMFQDYAKRHGIDFYIVQDDDTQNYTSRPMMTGQIKKGFHKTTEYELQEVILGVERMMRTRHIGLWGLSQTGDAMGEYHRLIRPKVMNFTFYLLPYLYRGERGEQDDDTSMFSGVMNEGYFTGSLGSGVVLQQVQSATAKGGLTDLYKTNKLLQKSLIVPIQFPSAVHAERQEMNGGRLHHRIKQRYLSPKLIKAESGERDNVAWDTFPEDFPFTNEPKRERR